MRIILNFILKMLSRTLIAITAATVMLCGCNLGVGANERKMNMEKPGINLTLKVNVQGSNLVATLDFRNKSGNIIFLDKYIACLDSEPTSNLFVITDETGKRVGYTGVMIKRRVSKEDFIQISSGDSVTSTIALNKWYEFPAGKYNYTIHYRAYNHSFGEQELIEIISNRVTIEFSK